MHDLLSNFDAVFHCSSAVEENEEPLQELPLARSKREVENVSEELVDKNTESVAVAAEPESASSRLEPPSQPDGKIEVCALCVCVCVCDARRVIQISWLALSPPHSLLRRNELAANPIIIAGLVIKIVWTLFHPLKGDWTRLRAFKSWPVPLNAKVLYIPKSIIFITYFRAKLY